MGAAETVVRYYTPIAALIALGLAIWGAVEFGTNANRPFGTSSLYDSSSDGGQFDATPTTHNVNVQAFLFAHNFLLALVLGVATFFYWQYLCGLRLMIIPRDGKTAREAGKNGVTDAIRYGAFHFLTIDLALAVPVSAWTAALALIVKIVDAQFFWAMFVISLVVYAALLVAIHAFAVARTEKGQEINAPWATGALLFLATLFYGGLIVYLGVGLHVNWFSILKVGRNLTITFCVLLGYLWVVTLVMIGGRFVTKGQTTEKDGKIVPNLYFTLYHIFKAVIPGIVLFALYIVFLVVN
jgi:hypothetical protein